MGATSDRLTPTVATVIGDGTNRDRIEWPSGYEFRHFKPRNIESIENAIRSGRLDLVMVHVPTVVSVARQRIKNTSGVKIVEWHKGLSAFTHELPSFLAPGEVQLKIVQAAKNVRVVEASKSPERRPSWGAEEIEALRTAFEDAVDFHRLIEGFLSLTQDMDVPVRSQAEIRTAMEKMRYGNAEELEALSRSVSELKAELETKTTTATRLQVSIDAAILALRQ